MNTLPRISVHPEAGGATARCHGCGWEMYHVRRPAVDAAARAHQAKCKRKGA